MTASAEAHSTSDFTSVAIVVPRYRDALTKSEATSLRHLLYFLKDYDRIFVAPNSLVFEADDFQVKRFDDAFFTGTAAYSRLLRSRQFYECFANYEYILIYQLDALVFSDQLQQWCKQDLDYIGAPWLKNQNEAEQGFSRVGNGGFSLRRTQTFLHVLETQSLPQRLLLVLRGFSIPLPDVYDVSPLRKLYHHLRVTAAIMLGGEQYAQKTELGEDLFWSDRAIFFDPEFKVASVETALKFAFEMAPRYCFEQNNHELPFGCHAWDKYDSNFWMSYLR